MAEHRHNTFLAFSFVSASVNVKHLLAAQLPAAAYLLAVLAARLNCLALSCASPALPSSSSSSSPKLIRARGGRPLGAAAELGLAASAGCCWACLLLPAGQGRQ